MMAEYCVSLYPGTVLFIQIAGGLMFLIGVFMAGYIAAQSAHRERERTNRRGIARTPPAYSKPKAKHAPE